MEISLTKLSGSILLGFSLIGAGCTALGASSPVPVPIESTGHYVYNANGKLLSVQVYGSKEKLNPTSLYVYSVTATKRAADEYVLSGTVTDGFGADSMRANRGMARATLNLTDVAPGTYKFIDSTTGKVVSTVETSAPPPPFTDPI